MINSATALGIPVVMSGAELLKANAGVNTLFESYLFNFKNGLDDLTE